MRHRWAIYAAAALLIPFALAGCGGQGFRRYSADDVVKALQAQGLGLTDVRPGQRDPASVAPNVAVEAQDFTIPSIAPKGGQVLIFAEQKDLDAMRTWFGRFPDLAPYVYTHHNAMLQLNSTLPRDEAERYRRALEGMK